jgi:hypothetical protein
MQKGLRYQPMPLLVPVRIVLPIVLSNHLLGWLLIHKNRKQADELGVILLSPA